MFICNGFKNHCLLSQITLFSFSTDIHFCKYIWKTSRLKQEVYFDMHFLVFTKNYTFYKYFLCHITRIEQNGMLAFYMLESMQCDAMQCLNWCHATMLYVMVKDANECMHECCCLDTTMIPMKNLDSRSLRCRQLFFFISILSVWESVICTHSVLSCLYVSLLQQLHWYRVVCQ